MIESEQKGYYEDKGQKVIITNLLPQLSPTRRELIFELSRRHMSRATSRWGLFRLVRFQLIRIERTTFTAELFVELWR